MFKIQNGVAYEQTLAFAGTNEKFMKMENMKGFVKMALRTG